MTHMPVCVDPSHSVGMRQAAPDQILDIMHATAQGIIAGANMVLVDFHPDPARALVDGPQALLLKELPWFIDDMQIAVITSYSIHYTKLYDYAAVAMLTCL